MARLSVFVTALLLFTVMPGARGQGADEAALLKKEVELLKRENELLKKENEALKKENELLKAKSAGTEKGAAKKPAGADLLVEGKVLSGTWRGNTSKTASDGKMTLTISERDKSKLKGRLAISFNVANKPDQNFDVACEINGNLITVQTVGGAAQINMSLTIKGDEIKGTYRNSAGYSGTIGFTLPK